MAIPSGLVSAQVNASDPSGRFQVGSGGDKTGRTHLVLWRDGIPRDLGTAHYGGQAVNRYGDIVGADYAGVAHEYRAWRYHSGRFIALHPLRSGFSAVPIAIDANGTVVGQSFDSGSPLSVPVLWTPHGAVRALALPPGDNNGLATALDTDGTIVGWAGYDPRNGTVADAHAVVWRPDGTVARILSPAGSSHGTRTEPTAVRAGTVVGTGYGADGSVALWWGPGRAIASVLTSGHATATAIGGRGSVAVDDLSDGQPKLLQNGATRVLATTPGQRATGVHLVAVTDTDTVYGVSYPASLRWNCRPRQ
jgi:hypothetical protein